MFLNKGSDYEISILLFSFISISVITLPHSFVMTNFYDKKINNMLFSVNDDSIDLENLIDNRCGRVYSFIERIRKKKILALQSMS